MAWQRPSCIVQAVQSVRQTARFQSFRPSSASLSPIPTHQYLLRPQTNIRSYVTETPPEGQEGSGVQEIPEDLVGAAPESPVEQTPPLAPASPALATSAAPPIDFERFAAKPARIVPRSPAYFSGSPRFIDHLLNLEYLMARHANLPILPSTEAPRKAWLRLPQFRDLVGEVVPSKRYKGLLKILQRLNQIDPAVIPANVTAAMEKYIRPGNPYGQEPVPPTLDSLGRAKARGTRKTSSAFVYLVEGEGEVMVNGKSLLEVFPRLHDRESATWPLRCTDRLDKYNLWASVRGGGVTGQAEAITLAVARALLVHEPALKPFLRKGMLPVVPQLTQISLANLFCSWCRYRRPPQCGKKEAWSCQGAQEAYLGQAVKASVQRSYVCTYMNLIFSCHWTFPLLDATTSMRALRALLTEYFLSQVSTQ